MNYKLEELNELLTEKEMRSETLEVLIEARAQKQIDFNLIDIREVFEYTGRSIDGTDLLLPTSMIQKHLPTLEAMKEEHIILYCRTGNRTGQIMTALERMGYKKVVHLSHGIIAFDGMTSHKAKIPNEL